MVKYFDANKQFEADKRYGEFVATVKMKADKGTYFYNDRVTWFVSGKMASRKDEKTGVVEFYALQAQS